MIPLSLETIAQAVGGELLNAPQPGLELSAVCTDSRAPIKGSLFIALRGERFDAHEFLPQVAAAGVAAAIIDQPAKQHAIAIPCIAVVDTRKALGMLGAFVRRRIRARTIAIGGSNGKTTTKHLVGSVLSSSLKGSQSPKSFNNDIGVPLTLLGVAPDDDYVILELGTNHPGELSPLSEMASPQIAVITSIGPEHLEGFGDLDGVRREELSLLDGLAPDSLVLVNSDDEPLPQMAQERAQRVVTFGFATDSNLRIESVESSLDAIRFRIAGEGEAYSLPLPGRHNAANALVAIAIGREMGIADPVIRTALAHCSAPEMRMQVQRVNGYTILNDAYNANPASMAAGLKTLSEAQVPGRRIAVLGEMRELGKASEPMHKDIGRLAAHAQLATLVAVGGNARLLADAAIAAGMAAANVYWVADSSAAASLLPQLLQPLDTILLKGSRGIKLEVVAQAIAKN